MRKHRLVVFQVVLDQAKNDDRNNAEDPQNDQGFNDRVPLFEDGDFVRVQRNRLHKKSLDNRKPGIDPLNFSWNVAIVALRSEIWLAGPAGRFVMGTTRSPQNRTD